MRQSATDVTIPVPRLPCGLPNVPIWRVSVDGYHRLLTAGIVTEDEALELLQGWLVPKMKKSPLHVFVAFRVKDGLQRLLPDDWWIGQQSPITMLDSEPEPDLAVLRGDFRDYIPNDMPRRKIRRSWSRWRIRPWKLIGV